MRMTEACYRNTGVEIEISAAIEISQRHPFTARDRQFGQERDRLQARCDEVLFFIEKRFGPRADFDG